MSFILDEDFLEYEEADNNDMLDENLTECQFKALRNTINWFYGKQLFKAIVGAAGTGKTYLTTEIISKLCTNACISAPTHKALENIVNTTGTKVGKTLQSLLGIAPDQDLEDFDPDNPAFAPKFEPTVKDYRLIVLDEASMVNAELRERIQELAFQSSTKILFIGDAVQLTPVGETVSTCFEQQYLDGGIDVLNTPVRQSISNPSYYLLLADRCNIERSHDAQDLLLSMLDKNGHLTEQLENKLLTSFQDKFSILIDHFGHKLINENEEGYAITSNLQAFDELMLKRFEEAINGYTDFNKVRFLSFQNAVVRQNGKKIRNHITSNAEELLAAGDMLMCYKPITQWNREKRRVETIINNSKEMVIVDVQKVYSEEGNEVYRCILESYDGKLRHSLDFIHPNSYSKYVAQILEHKANYKNRGWMPYYNYLGRHIPIEDLAKDLNNKNLPPKMFDYGYALTVHKSQGSTYQDVFIDLDDIYNYFNISKAALQREGKWNAQTERETKEAVYRLRYVAMSRAKKLSILKYTGQ